jgi:hypothetical protein
MSHRLLPGAVGLLLLAAAPQHGDEAEGQAVMAVENLGGTVVGDESDPAKPVIEVNLSDTPVTNTGLKQLAALKRLKSLKLNNCKGVTDAGLVELAALKELKELVISRTKVTDAGLKDLAALKGLKELDLTDTAVTGDCLKELAPLRELETLYVSDVEDDTLRALRKIGRISWLHRAQGAGGKRPLTSADVIALDLAGTSVTDAGLKELADLRNLHSLNLNNTEVTDKGLKELARFKRLETLNLDSCHVTDAGLRELAELSGLKVLTLYDSFIGYRTVQVTDAGVAELKKALPYCTIKR